MFRLKLYSLTVAMAVAAFLAGMYVEVPVPAGAAAPSRLMATLIPLPDETAPNIALTASVSDPVEAYYSALRKIKQNYYGNAGTDESLTYAAIRGMLGALGDRYTRFLEPDEFKRMSEENRGEFGGIGAQLERTQSKILIKKVLKDTPAMRAGLQPGDEIIAIDGTPTTGLSIFKAVDIIRGPRGSQVKLTIRRKDKPTPLLFTISRDIIQLETVEYGMVKGHEGIAHIQLNAFNQTSDQKLNEALTEMEKQGMKALILDLRNNPGGLLTEAVAVGSRFIDSGPVVIIEGGGQRRPMMVDRSKQNHKRVPLVVLVNKFSASASEIVAGAVKDNKTGIILGQPTWGKGLVQTITPIQGGSAVLITTHRYLTPAGIDINEKGIVPDVKSEPTPEDVEKGRDVELEDAVAFLEGKLNPTARRPVKEPAGG